MLTSQTEMIKKETGVEFSPKDFRKLEQCVSCLKASHIKYGRKCEVCTGISFKYCENCECILREGLHQFYSYDNQEVHRELETEFLASKESVREFIFEEVLLPLVNEKVCARCSELGFTGMKDICFWCDNDFSNSEVNYKLNGNTCEDCLAKFQLQGLNNDKEARNN